MCALSFLCRMHGGLSRSNRTEGPATEELDSSARRWALPSAQSSVLAFPACNPLLCYIIQLTRQ